MSEAVKGMSESQMIAEKNLILLASVGSTVHGLHLGGQDDRDEMGVCVEPPDYVLGLRDFEQWVYRTKPEGVRSGPGDLDSTIYGLRKFSRLAAKGNPSILVLLFSKPIKSTGLGTQLQGMADAFASKIAVRKFLGYMTAQKERLLGERGQMRVHRPELIEAHGFDTKYAMHALRLGHQGLEYAETGKITLPLPEPHRSELLAVRKGERGFETVKQMYSDLESGLERALEHSPLPQEPDWHRINSFLIRCYLDHWQYNHSVRIAVARMKGVASAPSDRREGE